MTASKSEAAALGNVRVLDFTSMMAGPYCTRLLADLGAEVIKVESPGGDEMRTRDPVKDGSSRYFGHLNAGKKSLTLNLKDEGARDAVLAMAANVDVVVENFRPGVMQRLGLDFAVLSRVNPRLIYCSISGYGQSGPDSLKPAYAPMVHAASGYDLALLPPDSGAPPAATTVFVADAMGGLYAASAIQTALYQRERTGAGQHIDVTLMETMLNLLMVEVQLAQQPGVSPRPRYAPLKARDGYVIVLPINPRNFANLCQAIDRPDLPTDQRFQEGRTRVKNWSALMAEIEKWTSNRDARDCEELLLAAGVPASRYRSVEAAFEDAQLAHRGTFATVSDDSGDFMVTCMPFTMSGSTNRVGASVPRLGEHTDSVLHEIARLDVEQIQRLAGSRTAP